MDVIPALQQLATGEQEKAKEALRQELAAYLNHLVLHDFAALIQLLYRVDVPEKKLKMVLQQHAGKDAGLLIADLLVQRQQEKNAARATFSSPNQPTEEEKW